MNENNPGRTIFLFLAVLGVSGAIGLAVMRSGSGAAEAAEDPVAEPVAKADADPEKEAEQEKKDEEPQVAKKAAKRKVIRWEGGAESDVAARREGMKVWAGPANQAPGRFGSGAAYQPGPNPGPPRFKVKR